MKSVFLSSDHYRVTRVVAALSSDDHVGSRSEIIDCLALALISHCVPTTATVDIILFLSFYHFIIRICPAPKNFRAFSGSARKIAPFCPLTERFPESDMNRTSVRKFRILSQPCQIQTSGGTVSLLGDDHLADIRFFRRLRIVIFIPVQKHDDVGVLLDRT